MREQLFFYGHLDCNKGFVQTGIKRRKSKRKEKTQWVLKRLYQATKVLPFLITNYFVRHNYVDLQEGSVKQTWSKKTKKEKKDKNLKIKYGNQQRKKEKNKKGIC